MSEGMQAVAGNSLPAYQCRDLQSFFAIIVGVVVTCVVQSSSITTVMVVGFVNRRDESCPGSRRHHERILGQQSLDGYWSLKSVNMAYHFLVVRLLSTCFQEKNDGGTTRWDSGTEWCFSV